MTYDRRAPARRPSAYTTLWRAVLPDAHAAIQAIGAFSNIEGIETKYFSLTLKGARAFARKASQAFGDGPFHIVRTSIEPVRSPAA